jgi:hypothetical protein
MSVHISPNLPANVVEIGNEITQAKLNEINAGTLALQTWVSASYLTTATASSTYQTQAGMSSYATQSYVTTRGYLTDAPSNGSEYVRKNGAWSVATGGGGGGSATWGSITGTLSNQTDLTSYVTGLGYIGDAPNITGNLYVRSEGAWTQFTGVTEAPSDGANYVRNMSAWTNLSSLGYQTASDVSTYVTGLGYITSSSLTVTNIDLTGNFNGYSMGSGYYTFKFDSSANTLRMQDGTGSGITISSTGITFPDTTTLTTAPISGGVITATSSYTISQADVGKIIVMPNASGSSSIDFYGAFVAGSVFYIVNSGSTYTADINCGMSYSLNGVYSATYSISTNTMKTLVCIGSNEFYIS